MRAVNSTPTGYGRLARRMKLHSLGQLRHFGSIFLGLICLVATVASCSDTSPVPETTARDESELISDDEQSSLVYFDGESTLLAGVAINPSEIRAGECFNTYQYPDGVNLIQQVTSTVSCETIHDHEAYFVAIHPAGEDEPFPGAEALRQWGIDQCLDEFENFVGIEYVLSALEIGLITPTFEDWTDRAGRNLVCYVFPDDGGRLLATARQSQI